jgi:hypothetical protein
MATYEQMIQRIAAEIKRPDLAPSIPLAIQSAIAFYAPAKFWFNEGQETTLTIANVATVGWPPDSQGVDSLSITVNGARYPLNQVPWREIDEKDTGVTVGVPEEFANFQQTFRFYPVPNDAYTITWYGTKSLATLTVGTDTNAWTTEAEELIRTRAKCTLMQDEPGAGDLVSRWAAREQEVLKDLLINTDRRIESGALRSWW